MTFSSTIVSLLALVLLAVPAAAQSDPVARIVYLGMDEDPYYQPRRAYTGVLLEDRKRPLDGALLAMKGTRVLGRALGIKFALDEVMLEPGADPAPALLQALEAGALAVLLDLPETMMSAALVPARPNGAMLFNIRHAGGRWRAEACAPDLFHTPPSYAMLSDALAQHLRAHGWDRVMILRGKTPDDLERAEAARRSLRKFGLSLVAEKVFSDTNDPRQRDRNNLLLLTRDASADILWLLDSQGEFGRTVPYATAHPTPVVGSQGLEALAWHHAYERHGAPQLNQRFRRRAKRDMAPEDWAAWVAVRSVIESVARTASAERDIVASYLRSGELSLDLYKGVPGNYRAWNRQLRQPVLLATHNAVIAWAPVSGFEHRLNTLDTLGLDEAENACR